MWQGKHIYLGMEKWIEQSIITVRLLTWLTETAVVIITTPAAFGGQIHYCTVYVSSAACKHLLYSCWSRGGQKCCTVFLLEAEASLPLGPDTANWSPFNFDKYSLFNLGPAVIQNYQEATLAIFMNPNISLILKSCCSFVWQHNWNEVIIWNWTGTSKQGSFPSTHWRHIKWKHSWCGHTVRGHRGPSESGIGYISF